MSLCSCICTRESKTGLEECYSRSHSQQGIPVFRAWQNTRRYTIREARCTVIKTRQEDLIRQDQTMQESMSKKRRAKIFDMIRSDQVDSNNLCHTSEKLHD